MSAAPRSRGSPPFILPRVADADAFLAVFPPGSDPRGDDRQLANAIKDELDAYNSLECGDDDSGDDSGSE